VVEGRSRRWSGFAEEDRARGAAGFEAADFEAGRTIGVEEDEVAAEFVGAGVVAFGEADDAAERRRGRATVETDGVDGRGNIEGGAGAEFGGLDAGGPTEKLEAGVEEAGVELVGVALEGVGGGGERAEGAVGGELSGGDPAEGGAEGVAGGVEHGVEFGVRERGGGR
jgi:hypothetical protein